MTRSVLMTTEAKRALAKTIRVLRTRLLTDLDEATERAYRLGIDANKANLSEAARIKRARLEGWIDEQVRALPAKQRAGAAARLRLDVVKDAAATLLVRLVYLRLREAAGLAAVKVVTGGWSSRGYKDFREVAPELARPGAGDETEGYAALLQLVFDELAHDLPGLYGPVRMTQLVPVPAATLRAVIDALDDAELSTVWTDDTTLGWIYQYWNDPEREALDAKLAASKKLENHEIASKTQMFTERYIVEWLLHNTLGQTWLAICQKNGWVARVQRPTGAGGDGPSVLDQLEARRIEWRRLRELGPDAGGVALDALMPIEAGLEDRWKYWVPQPLPADAVPQAPASIRDLKLLDPACGSGHFLVIASELLFHLYLEEAWQRGEAASPDAGATEAAGSWSPRRIVEAILESNLFGVDIDPKAVQIAAAALMLKAQQLCPAAQPRTLNLVAPALSLGSLPADDPARAELYAAVEADTGIPPALTARIVDGLAGADHLGTLLRVDAAIDQAIADHGAQLSARVPTKADQGSLFDGYAPEARAPIGPERARTAVLGALEGFLAKHSGGGDLGLRLRGEQLAAGVRFVRTVREGQYDIVVGNPPYQGTSKMADKAYVEQHYPRGKADLYAAFLERGLQLARPGGMSSLLTMRNWMFIKQFSALREWLLANFDLRMLGDVDRGAFDEVPNEVLAAVMSVFRSTRPGEQVSVAMQPTPLDDKSYDRERTRRKRAAVLCQMGRFEFQAGASSQLDLCPLVYWWPASLLTEYLESPKVENTFRARSGVQTSNDTRFLRAPWEVAKSSVYVSLTSDPFHPPESIWVPYIGGAGGEKWFDSTSKVVRWALKGLELNVWISEYRLRVPGQYIKNVEFYFKPGIAFVTIGNEFSARCHRFRSIFGTKGASVFPDDVPLAVCLLNSRRARFFASSFNPGLDFTSSDVNRLPVLPVPGFNQIFAEVERSFSQHESHREPSLEFTSPGPSSWLGAQAWAAASLDRGSHSIPAYQPQSMAAGESEHLSYSMGVALGRFGAHGEGSLNVAPSTSLNHGILFLSDASDDDGLAQAAAAPILAAWAEHGAAIDDKRTLKNYLQDRFFADIHRKMYENRPIYFPLSSARKSFVAYVSIHRWTADTLTHLLAQHLEPARKRLEGELVDLRAARDGADKKASKAAERRLGDVTKWLDELITFIAAVELCADKGPPPSDSKTTPRAADARYAPDLDDGVMINSAALWALLDPQWKDPKKWWKELANAEGKKDYDWSHLAARYFPARVDAKCQVDPSLAVAHGCFWKYHPAKAYHWELRLQDEIRPDFTLDEPGSDAARAAFLAAEPDQAAALLAKEQQRRARKAAKSAGATADGEDDDAPQGDLDLDTTDDDGREDES